MGSVLATVGGVISNDSVRIDLTPTAPPGDADATARANYQINLKSLEEVQPIVNTRLTDISLPYQWTFGRDGFLTARDGQSWWSGCSVPLTAGREMFRELQLAGQVGCLVCPWNAGQIRACFEAIRGNQAIIAIVPDLSTLAVILHCDNFSREIAARRLLFAAGWDWAQQLASIFKTHPGLPLPQIFVRTAQIDDTDLSRFTVEAQEIISLETARRTDRISLLLNSSNRRLARAQPLTILASAYFQLDDLSPIALGAICNNSAHSSFIRLDPDDPSTASPLAIATAAQNSSAIVTANMFRRQLPGTVPNDIPWITWVTLGPHAIESPDHNCPDDGVLLSDAAWIEPARKIGWRDEQIALADWPANLGLSIGPARGRGLGLFADTLPLEMPKQLQDFSSHGLLWEMIAEEMKSNPLIIGTQPLRYLESRMARLDVAGDNLDPSLFLNRLIIPAYHQGIARAAISSQLPVALFGKGWDEIDEFRDSSRGPVNGAGELAGRLAECAALIHPMASGTMDAWNSFGFAAIQPAGSSMRDFLADCRKATTVRPVGKKRAVPPLSPGRVLSLIPGLRWPASSIDSAGNGSD